MSVRTVTNQAEFDTPTDVRAVLQAERELIERRAYLDWLRLREIRQQLDALDDDPTCAVWG